MVVPFKRASGSDRADDKPDKSLLQIVGVDPVRNILRFNDDLTEFQNSIAPKVRRVTTDTGGEFICEATLCSSHPQGSKGRTAGFGRGRAQPPLPQPDHVEGHRYDHMLQMGLRQPEVPGPT